MAGILVFLIILTDYFEKLGLIRVNNQLFFFNINFLIEKIVLYWDNSPLIFFF